MVKRILVLTLLALPFALRAAAPSATQSNWVYLQNGSSLRISIETYQAREGWTPVIVSVAGADVSAVMDGQGRVFQAWAKGSDKYILPFFTIELEKGRILLGRESHAIRVYEQNSVRTRFVIAEGAIALPLSLGQGNKAGTLRFGGLEVPAQVREADHAASSRLMKPAPAKPGLTAIRPAGFTAPLPVEKGPRSMAQLIPSQIRARGK